MANPILEQLNRGNNVQSNGYSINDLQTMIRNNGGPKGAFYALANKMGVNPYQIISQVNTMTNQQMQNMMQNNPMVQQLANMLK